MAIVNKKIGNGFLMEDIDSSKDAEHYFTSYKKHLQCSLVPTALSREVLLTYGTRISGTDPYYTTMDQDGTTPHFYHDENTGMFYTYRYLAGAVDSAFIHRSEDYGETWTAIIPDGVAGIQGPDQLSAFTSNQTTNVLYFADSDALILFSSSDSAVTFSPVCTSMGIINPKTDFMRGFVASGSQLGVLGYDAFGRGITFQRSLDNGGTWADGDIYSGNLGTTGNIMRPNGVVRYGANILYCGYYLAQGGAYDNYNIGFVRHSNNYGATGSWTTVLEDLTGSQFYSIYLDHIDQSVYVGGCMYSSIHEAKPMTIKSNLSNLTVWTTGAIFGDTRFVTAQRASAFHGFAKDRSSGVLYAYTSHLEYYFQDGQSSGSAIYYSRDNGNEWHAALGTGKIYEINDVTSRAGDSDDWRSREFILGIAARSGSLYVDSGIKPDQITGSFSRFRFSKDAPIYLCGNNSDLWRARTGRYAQASFPLILTTNAGVLLNSSSFIGSLSGISSSLNTAYTLKNVSLSAKLTFAQKQTPIGTGLDVSVRGGVSGDYWQYFRSVAQKCIFEKTSDPKVWTMSTVFDDSFPKFRTILSGNCVYVMFAASNDFVTITDCKFNFDVPLSNNGVRYIRDIDNQLVTDAVVNQKDMINPTTKMLDTRNEFPHAGGLFQMPNIILGTQTTGKIGRDIDDSMIAVTHKGSVGKVFWPRQSVMDSSIKGYGDLAPGQNSGKLTTVFDPGESVDVTGFDHLALYCYLVKDSVGTSDEVAVQIERKPLLGTGFATEQAVEYTLSGSATEALLRDLIYTKAVDYSDLSLKEIGYTIDVPLTNVKQVRVSARHKNGQASDLNKNLIIWGRLIKSTEET